MNLLSHVKTKNKIFKSTIIKNNQLYSIAFQLPSSFSLNTEVVFSWFRALIADNRIPVKFQDSLQT